MQKIKFLSVRHACADPDNSNGEGGGGGGGGGVKLLLEGGRFLPVFLLGNKLQLMIFMGGGGAGGGGGGSGPSAPSVSAHIRVSNSLNSHFINLSIFAWPVQFTKRLLIISADTKGKDSMILFKIKETAHINSGHARKCTLHKIVAQVL